MAFQLKSFPQIMRDMISVFLANSPVNDVNKGSVLSTFLEAAATEDFAQYYQMLEIINNYNLDHVTGQDLDNRAIEYGLSGRIPAIKATNQVTISDTAFTKKSTKVYAGLAGPVVGQTQIFVDEAAGFPASGSLIVGRGSANAETISYTSIVAGINFDTINLASGLANDHGTDETVILSQGGNRSIPAGTIVKVPASDFSSDILFTTNLEETIQDGEDSLAGIAITAVLEGTSSNVPAGSINTFDSKPFPTAVVTNPTSINNGLDLETDDQLRNRIKDTIQSLSKGTKKSIITGVVGIIDTSENKRVVSANLIEGTEDTDITRLVIDDGTGFEPSFLGRGFETVIENATGGEEFLQLDLFPVVKATILTVNSEPYAITNGLTLIYRVNEIEETVTFTSSDFNISGSVLAQEVVAAINNKATLIEARTTSAGKKVEIKAKINKNETIQVTGGTANAANILNFPTSIFETLKLYKFDGRKLYILEKDGTTALLINDIQAPYNFSASPKYLDIQMDHEVMFSGEAEGGSGLDTVVDSNLASRFIVDEDLTFKYVTFNSGVNIGLSAPVVSYDAGTGTITLSGGLTVATGDLYQVDDTERVYFSNVNGQDFANSAAATAAEVAAVINRRLKHVASVTDSLTKVQLTSQLENSSDSGIKIHGGTANAILGFDTLLVSGANKDYTFNRFNGQIQLATPLLEGEDVTAGTRISRGFLITQFSQPYVLTNGDTITVEVDGGAGQVVTFNTADFSNIAQASAEEVVAVINSTLEGGSAFVTDDNRINIRTNTFDESLGSIEVTATSGTAFNLGFDVGVLSQSIKSHIAAILSLTPPYNFVEGDRLVIVLDNDATTKTFDVAMDLDGTVVAPTGSPLDSFTANITSIAQNFTNKFLTNDDLAEMKIIWKTATNPLNVDEEREVVSYDATSGIITLDTPLPANITAGDTFILIPVTVKNVVTYLNNTSTSTFSLVGEAAAAVNGTKVQLSTKTDGGDGFVNVTGGIANNLSSELSLDSAGFDIYVENTLWQIGMDVTVSDDNSAPLNTSILAVTPDDPTTGTYKLTLANDASAYTIAQNAIVSRRNILGFSTSPIQGVDPYKYYTGLLRTIQRTVDGLESDQAYPGIKAAGAQIEVLPPLVQKLVMEIDVTLGEGLSISTVLDDVKNAVSSYVNSTKVGEDIVLNEIIERIMGVSGIVDVDITSPSANVAIADGEIARISDNDIIIG